MEHEVSLGEKPEPEKPTIEPTVPEIVLSVMLGGRTIVVDGAVV